MLRLFTTGNFLVVGPPNAGKSYWVQQLLLNWHHLCDTRADKIYFFYEKWQGVYDALRMQFKSKIFFIYGLSEGFAEKYLQAEKDVNKICVFDDQMTSISAHRTEIEKLFITSRHANVSVVYIAHNLFYKEMRTISLNTTYTVLFGNSRDLEQITRLGRRMFSHIRKGSQKFLSIYQTATHKPYGYILIDYRSKTPENMRILGDIFQEFPTVYVVE